MRAGAKGIVQSTDLVPMGFDGTTLTLLHHPTGANVVRTPDWVVLAVPAAPDEQLYLDLKAAGVPVERVGDCVAPRRAHAAVVEGERAGASMTMPRGGSRPSSTRSTSARSPTPTATASATSRACAGGSATSPRSASTPSGCARCTRRRSATTATTSPTTSAIDPAYGDLATFDRLVATARDHGLRVLLDIVPNHCSDQHPWFQAALAAAPGSDERARFWFRDGLGRTAEQLAGGVRRLGLDARRRRRPAVVPRHVHAVPARLRPPPPGRRRDVRRRPALLVRPRRRRLPGRRRVAGRQGPGPARRRSAGPRRVQHRHPLPARGPRGVAAVAPGPRRLHGRPSRPRRDDDRRGLRPAAAGPDGRSTPAPTSSSSASPSTSCCRRGTVRRCAGRSARRSSTSDRTGRGRRSRSTTTTPSASSPASATTTRPTPRRGRATTCAPRRAPSTSPPAPAGPGPPPACCWRCPAPCTSTRARSSGLPEVLDMPDDARQDPVFAGTGGRKKGRDGCRVPLPWTAEPGGLARLLARRPSARRRRGCRSRRAGAGTPPTSRTATRPRC